jgi:hypothetical protein
MHRRRGAITIIASALVVWACGSNESGGSGGVGASGDGGVDASTGLGGNTDASSIGPHDGAASGDVSTGNADASSGDGSGDAANASGADGAIADGALADGATDAPGSCLTSSTQLAIVQTATGCSFPYTGAQSPGAMNLYLTPGWGTVCFAGGSTGCGTGSGADGWWFSGPQEIALCDATCSRFYNQTIAGKLTVQLGCPTEMCMH